MPYLPDDERAQRLNALRSGEIELTELKKKTLLAAKSLMQKGKKLTTRAVYDAVKGKVGQKRAEAALKHLREMGLLEVGTVESGTAAVPQD